MDIDGLGPAVLADLLDRGLVDDISDFYALTLDDLTGVEHFQERAAGNLLANIAASRDRPLDKVLFGLGIRHVGSTVAELLSARFHTMEGVTAASVEELAAVEGVGPKIAVSVRVFFDGEENMRVVGKLERAGVVGGAVMSSPGDGPLAGLTFVLTGALDSMTRDEAESALKSLGLPIAKVS